MSLEELFATACISFTAAGIAVGAWDGIWQRLAFELVGIRRRKRLKKYKPMLRLARRRGIKCLSITAH